MIAIKTLRNRLKIVIKLKISSVTMTFYDFIKKLLLAYKLCLPSNINNSQFLLLLLLYYNKQNNKLTNKKSKSISHYYKKIKM